MKKRKCPRCHSTDITDINDYQVYITVDETVTVVQYLCISCKFEWDD